MENKNLNKQTESRAVFQKALLAEEKISLLRVGLIIFNPLIYFLLMDNKGTLPIMVWIILGILIFYGLWILILKPYKKNPYAYSIFFTIVDSILITGWMHTTGGANSPFFPLYYVALVAVAFRFSFGLTLSFSGIYTFLYLLVSLIGENFDGNYALLVSRIVHFFIIALLAGFISHETFKQYQERVFAVNEQKKLKVSLDNLMSNETTFSQILESLPIGLFIVKANGTPFFMNKVAISILGKSVSDYKSKVGLVEFYKTYKAGTNEFYPEEETPLFMALKGKTTVIDDVEIRQENKTIPLEVHGAPVYNEKGEIEFAVIWFADISYRLEAQKKESELASVVRSSQDAIISMDTNGMIKSWNPGAVKIFGHSEEEAVGNSVFLIIPNDRVNEEYEILKKIRKGEIVIHYETKRKHKSGKILNISLTVSPIKDKFGKIIGASKVARDVTEAKRTEEEIIKTNKFLNTILNNIPNMIFVKDAKELKFVRFNKAGEEFLGIPQEEMLGKSDFDFFPHDQAEFFINKDKEVLANKNLIDIKEEPIQTENGLRWLHTKKIPLLDSQGKPEYLLGISEDITEQKEATEKIKSLNIELTKNIQKFKEANKELESFTYSVSHDLRAPLRAISGYSQILFEDYIKNLDEDARRMLKEVSNNAIRMGNLIDDLLAFSRLSRKDFVKHDVDIKNVFEQIIQVVKAENPNLKIKVNEKEILPALGDENMLRQVIVNLLSNAVKYSRIREEIKIEVGSYKEDGSIVYYVNDNGVGFDMSYYSNLFGVFQRLHSEEDFEGTGVGLAIVKRIINKHGGKVWAQAEPDKGATFYFSLPI
jgi:PAS domain S-box-containing protein